jgi:hypothetical protein
MKTKLYWALSFGVLCFELFSHAQDSSLPQGWTKTTFPASTSGVNKDLLCANSSNDEWQVGIESGKLRVSRWPHHKDPALPRHFALKNVMRGRAVVAKAGDGWLVGYDAGEFGGGLWWVGEDGRKSTRLLGDDVHAIVPRAQELLVFTGLAHMTMDEGNVYSYRPAVRATGSLARLVDLGSSPADALAGSNGTVFVAAHTRVVALDSSNQLRVLFQNEEMGILYPNSIAEDPDGNLFVGMRFYVLRLERTATGQYIADWYAHGRCH